MQHQPRLRNSAAFTLLELLVAVAVVAILVAISFPIASQLTSRAQRVQCSANLRNLYLATELFVQQNGNWPQIEESDDEDENDSDKSWIEALSPFGITAKTWVCPTVQNRLGNPNFATADSMRIDYVATPFDDKPMTPHQWPRQPWFIEVGDVHGHGNLIIFTDGSMSDLRTVINNRSGK